MERSLTTSSAAQGAVAGAALVAAGYLYYRWLNLPITVEIPEFPAKPTAGFDALAAAGDLMVDEASLSRAVANGPEPGERFWSIEEKEALVDANLAALQAARDTLDLECWIPPRADGNRYWPRVVKFRNLTMLLALDSQVKENRGDHGAAVNASLDALQIAVTIARGGTVSAATTGHICE